MATVDVLNWEKKKVGSVELNSEIFEAPVRKDVLHEVVKWQLASRRQGTHKTKTRGEVRGGGRKPFKQKGTGNARQGSSRSPLQEGGAVIFGPRPRSYDYQLPKKVRQLGLRSALSYLKSEGRLHVVDSMQTEEAKTKELSQRLKNFGADKAVLVDQKQDDKFDRASRNLRQYRYYSVEGVNVFDLLKFDRLILTKDSLESLVTRCGAGS